MTQHRIATLLSLLTLAGACQAQVAVSEAWVRGTVPAQKVTGAFMQLTSKTDVRLVAVTSPAAGMVEMHEMTTGSDGVMSMRGVESVALPAGKVVELKPGGYHLMLMALKQPLKAGDQVPLTLVVEDKDKQRSSLTVQAPVRALGAAAPMPMDAKH